MHKKLYVLELSDKSDILRKGEKIMKRLLILVAVSTMLTIMALGSGQAIADPAKDFYGGKTAGNSGFTNIVGDNFPGTVSGWVRYSKVGKCLHTTWVIWGLDPLGMYQLKLHSKEGDAGIGNACGCAGCGAIWQCGFWGSESFLVMATVQADEDGHISFGLTECRLPSGNYEDAQFIVTQNSAPWSSAWTWENSTESDSPADPWNGDISTFKIK